MAANVVLKLADSCPVQSVELDQYPDDLDELDDAVLDLTRGRAYTMTMAGVPFSEAAFQARKAKREKIVVHVHMVGVSASPPPAAADSGTEWIALAGPANAALSEQDFNEAVSGVWHIRRVVQSAEKMVGGGTSNLLIRATEQEIAAYKDLERKARRLAEFDPDLGRDAQTLIQRMNTTFGDGLTELATTRRTVLTIQMLGGELSKAFTEGRMPDAKRLMAKMGLFVKKMEELSAAYAKKVDADHQEWITRFMQYKRQEEAHAEQHNFWVGRIVVAGSAAPAIVASAFMFFGPYTALGSFAIAATSCGSYAVGAEHDHSAMRRYRHAHESAGGFTGVVAMASGATAKQQELWAGIAASLKEAYDAFGDSGTMGVDDRRFVASMFADFAKSIASLVHSMDEYLVFISERQFFPGTFQIRENILDAKTYDEIKLLLGLAPEEPVEPGRPNSRSSPSAVAVGRIDPSRIELGYEFLPSF